MLTKKTSILLVLILTVTNWSCFFRTTEEMTADAEEEIRQSEALQKLEKMCINLPVFSRIKPREKRVIRGRMVSYDYPLIQNSNDLKEVFKNKFLSEGWTLTEEKRLMADEFIRFVKGKLEFSISKRLFNEEEYYTISCKDNSITN